MHCQEGNLYHFCNAQNSNSTLMLYCNKNINYMTWPLERKMQQKWLQHTVTPPVCSAIFFEGGEGL